MRNYVDSEHSFTKTFKKNIFISKHNSFVMITSVFEMRNNTMANIIFHKILCLFSKNTLGI